MSNQDRFAPRLRIPNRPQVSINGNSFQMPTLPSIIPPPEPTLVKKPNSVAPAPTPVLVQRPNSVVPAPTPTFVQRPNSAAQPRIVQVAHVPPPAHYFYNPNPEGVLPNVNTKKFTLQIVRHKNIRGSFNTVIYAPVGYFPTLNSLKVKVDVVAKSHQVEVYAFYYRYGVKGTKYLLEEESAFDDIDWNDERLTFNAEEVKVGVKRPNSGVSDEPKKKRSKFDEQNEKIQAARIKLQQELPQETQSRMSHKDWIQMSYLNATRPQQWTLDDIIRKFNRSSNSISTVNVNPGSIMGSTTTASTLSSVSAVSTIPTAPTIASSSDPSQMEVLLNMQATLSLLEKYIRGNQHA